MPETTIRGPLTVYLLPARRGRYRLLSPELEAELRALAEEESSPGPPAQPEQPDRRPDPEPEQRPDREPGERPDAGGGARRWLHRGIRWLRTRGGPTERVLRELRLPDAVEVVHPAGLPEGAARRIFREQIEEWVRRHRRWMWVDGALVPLSVVLSLIPGPNLLLPYLAWRTVSHWRGQRGGSRALDGAELEATFVPDPTLDPLLDLADRRFVLHRGRRLRAIGEAAGLPDLDRHL